MGVVALPFILKWGVKGGRGAEKTFPLAHRVQSTGERVIVPCVHQLQKSVSSSRPSFSALKSASPRKHSAVTAQQTLARELLSRLALA